MIAFNDLKPLHALLADDVTAAVHRVLASGWYILGPEVEAFEAAFAAYHGVAHAVGVANGTDAITLGLRAAGIGSGDEVITVAHTAAATVCGIHATGATPVFVDIDPVTYTIDPGAVAAAVTRRTRAIVAVHLYGHPADLTALAATAERHRLLLLEDCAQAHGARHRGRLVGTLGSVAAFSFYPTKNLGAYGDGGAVLTNDAHLAHRVRRLRNYGQQTRYECDEPGINSRLDAIQAAILALKLKHLDTHNTMRRRLAARYAQRLRGVTVPEECSGATHVYHLYVVRHPRRDQLQKALAERGIGTLMHYPIPVHLQPAYQPLGYRRGSLPVTEQVASEVLSLPLYLGMTPSDVETVADAVNTSVPDDGA
jgi:dTDP-4-amino-4,6-dideoxygalactose transaminase